MVARAPMSTSATTRERIESGRCRHLGANRGDDIRGNGPTGAEHLGEEVPAALRDGLAVDLDFELAGRADRELGREPELLLDGSGETRRSFAVASGGAVEDLELHRVGLQLYSIRTVNCRSSLPLIETGFLFVFPSIDVTVTMYFPAGKGPKRRSLVEMPWLNIASITEAETMPPTS